MNDLAARQGVYRGMLASFGAAVWRAHPTTGMVMSIGPEVEPMLGYPVRDWLDHPNFWVDHIHPEDRERTLAFCSGIADNPGQPGIIEYRFITADGRVVWLRSVANAIIERGQLACVGVLFDITPLRGFHDATSLLAERVVDAQEDERRRLARDLHDDVIQKIAVVAFELDRLCMRSREKEPPRVEDLERLWSIVNGIAQDVHAISRELQPRVVEAVGLPQALHNLCAELAKRLSMRVVPERIDPEVRLDARVALSLYRIAQESLHNAMTHSRADVVTVRLIAEHGEVAVEIEDDGVGFDLGSASTPDHMGLHNMHERMESVNGTLTIVSSVGHGTKIRGVVPLTS